MSQNLPKENIRPGMFVSVGPSAFTVAGIVNIAAQASRPFPDNFMNDGALAANVMKTIVNFASLWVWGYELMKIRPVIGSELISLSLALFFFLHR